MKFTMTCIAALLTTAVALAPIASADTGQPQQSCANLGGTQNICQSPGNTQIYDAPPQVDYYPYAGGAT